MSETAMSAPATENPKKSSGQISTTAPPLPRYPSRFRLLRPKDFPQLPQVSFAIDGLLPMQGVVCVFGASQAGKSAPMICTVACVTRSPHAPAYRKLRAALATARTRAGLTQGEVAAKLKKPQSFVLKCESGERSLDVVEFVSICRVLGVPPLSVLEQL